MNNWDNNKQIAESLEENFPEEELIDIEDHYLKELILALPEHDGEDDYMSEEFLHAVLEAWQELRDNM